jgi:hypoxanthine phosphoribosyltransferase
LETKEDNSQNTALGAVLIDSATIKARVHELGAQITAHYKEKYPLLVGVLKGASIFHADLVRAIPLDLSYDFIAVGSYGSSTSSSGRIRILKDLDQNLEREDVLLVENIIDTGLTLHYLASTLRARKPKSLHIAVLLNKQSRRQVDLPLDYVGFDVPDRFLVGYGLDYDQRYRNLPDIRFLAGT